MQNHFLLDGRYLLGDRLGKGGMAEVCQARDTRMERDVAVKRLKSDLAEDPLLRKGFQREVHVLARIRHTNIVTVFDTGEYFDEDAKLTLPYLVMELLDGQTLRDLVLKEGKLPPAKAFAIAKDILNALGHLHQQGIIHRDIKPANVMLTSNGEVKVMDFGIAHIESAETVTTATSVPGTPHYLSPEQIQGAVADARSDLYALGCLLYELLTGRPPFIGVLPARIIIQHLQTDPTPPSQIEAGLSKAIDEVCLKALAKDPANRYQSAQEMLADLDRTLTPQAIPLLVVDDHDLPVSDDKLARTLPQSSPETDTFIKATPVNSQSPPKPLEGYETAKLPVKPSQPDEAEDEEESKSRKRFIPFFILLAVVLMLAGGGVGISRLLGQAGARLPETTATPNPTQSNTSTLSTTALSTDGTLATTPTTPTGAGNTVSSTTTRPATSTATTPQRPTTPTAATTTRPPTSTTTTAQPQTTPPAATTKPPTTPTVLPKMSLSAYISPAGSVQYGIRLMVNVSLPDGGSYDAVWYSDGLPQFEGGNYVPDIHDIGRTYTVLVTADCPGYAQTTTWTNSVTITS
ncbi:MAG: protein kinase [Propionibacteriaceae bacterium]|jgi:serine/threonine-protein kinase|nr:protein kinase [Propionibacteriaceae bacterium]